MRLVPAAQSRWAVEQISGLLARLLLAAHAHAAGTIRNNFTTVFGAVCPRELVGTQVRRLLAVTVWNSLTMHTLPTLSKQQIADLVPVEGAAHLDECLAGAHPVLVWAFHFGVHPLLVAAILHARGYPILVVSHMEQMPAESTTLQRAYLHRLGHMGDQFPVIDPREGLKRGMLDVLKEGRCLFVTPDYMMPVDEAQPASAFDVEVRFLDRSPVLQAGSLRLAKRLGARAVTVLSAEDEWKRLRLVVEPFDWPTAGLTPADLRSDLQASMTRLEAQVISHPHLWWDLKRDDLLQRLAGCRGMVASSLRHTGSEGDAD
jgi:lauroyl/myristoyl acyltransferase